jgi:hypothetical protein
MIATRMLLRLPRWLLLVCAMAMCAPVLAQPQSQSTPGIWILPHAGAEYSFSGWQSEAALPASLTVPLELGEEIYGATLQLQPIGPGASYRVSVQYETSLGLSAEGPHLDLLDWKHCISDWQPAQAHPAADIDGTLSFSLPTPSPEHQACFPPYTQAQLKQAVHDYADKAGDPQLASRWLQGLQETSAEASVSTFVAISTVRVRVQVLRNGRWREIATLAFLPTMGC